MKGWDKSGRVAAFFDLDGTLIGEPSLEQRFFSGLRQSGGIPRRNYLRWLLRAACLAPRGMEMVRHANKMYLRGGSGGGCGGSRQESGQTPRETSRQPKMAVPRFFPGGVDQVAWHARQGHSIVLVSGTLAPLAREMALALVIRLGVRGIAAAVTVCATRLEEIDGRWTGRIVGDAMFGEAKARAVLRLADENGFDLARCYAYGDGWNDRWMLESVGRAVAVNPCPKLEALARKREWAVVAWLERELLQTLQAPQRPQGRRESVFDQGNLV
jgi:HAD superfamily hydrolase (TIGR01490 family)